MAACSSGSVDTTTVCGAAAACVTVTRSDPTDRVATRAAALSPLPDYVLSAHAGPVGVARGRGGADIVLTPCRPRAGGKESHAVRHQRPRRVVATPRWSARDTARRVRS